MLPLQITLDGFMSYRDKTTISFEGAPLWMLAGANGAGKSSVFDAMRWALFGAHRGGKSGHEALINRGKNRLRVAFDFELDGKRFRLLRTLARAGRATWQIEEIVGETEIKIPETDMREGYEKWVRENIGLGDETFCTAMYLAQNRGDAILSVSPNQRYEMLAEIVDISAYAALHERAKTKASQLEIASRAAERAWQLAPGARSEEIAEWHEKSRALNAQMTENAARREQILGLEPLAKQWQNWEKERQATAEAWEAARVLLNDAPRIERDFARLGELAALLGPLSRYVEARERAARNRREAENAARRGDAASDEATQLQRQLRDLQSELNALEAARHSAEAAQLALYSESVLLSPRLSRARQIALYGAEIRELESQLTAFPTELKTQITELETRIARAQDELAAGTILTRFAREKVAYQAARTRKAAAQSEGEKLQLALPILQDKAQKLGAVVETERQKESRALEQLAAARARLSDARKASSRFVGVQNEALCFYCGQELTPEHAEKERLRLEIALQNAENETQNAQIMLDCALKATQDAQKQCGKAQNEVRNAERALETARSEQQNAQLGAENLRTSAHSTWNELSDQWQARAGLTPSSNLSAASSTQRLEEGVSPAFRIWNKRG